MELKEVKNKNQETDGYGTENVLNGTKKVYKIKKRTVMGQINVLNGTKKSIKKIKIKKRTVMGQIRDLSRKKTKTEGNNDN